MSLATEDDGFDEYEILAMEEIWRELHHGGEVDDGTAETEILDDDEVMEEHEAKEVLNTMINQKKKKTFTQSLRTKKAKALARGFGQWRDGGKSSGRSSSSMSTTGLCQWGVLTHVFE